MNATLGIDSAGFERLQEAMKQLPWGVEEAINDVLHNEGGALIQDSIRLLIPESRKVWKGKGAPAKSGNSLRAENSNLAVTVRSTKKYQYLYFPDDGTNTCRHAGDQQFFLKGAENVSSEIVERCITKIMNMVEEGV